MRITHDARGLGLPFCFLDLLGGQERRQAEPAESLQLRRDVHHPVELAQCRPESGGLRPRRAVQAIDLVRRDDGKQSRVGEASAEKEAIARIDGVIPVGGGGVDAVVVAVLVVMEKGIVHIPRERGGGIAEQDRVRRVIRSHRSHRVLDVVPPLPPRTESHRYLGAGEHEPAIRSSTIVGLVVGNAHGERAQSINESRPQVDLAPASLRGRHAQGRPAQHQSGTITTVVPTIAIEFILRSREHREHVSEEGLIRRSHEQLLRRHDRPHSLLRLRRHRRHPLIIPIAVVPYPEFLFAAVGDGRQTVAAAGGQRHRRIMAGDNSSGDATIEVAEGGGSCSVDVLDVRLMCGSNFP